MDITEMSGTWQLYGGAVRNRRTGVVVYLDNNAEHDPKLGTMSEKTFVRKCRKAFQTGHWPI